jgi:hypothetical protein
MPPEDISPKLPQAPLLAKASSAPGTSRSLSPGPRALPFQSRQTHNRSDPLLGAAKLTAGNESSMDLMAHLQRSGSSIVKTRTGSVLSRGFILKTDHYPSGK